jgi:hypothetical protein
MKNELIYGYLTIVVLISILIVLVVILYDMHKTGTTWGRKIPTPPQRLKPCEHRFDILEVINIELDPKCKKCGKKLSVLKNTNSCTLL